MNPEEIYLEHLRTIERIAAFVARRNHLGPDDTAEFVQDVRVCLLEDDYAIIRKFEGRSSFSTYLTTVIVRLFHQWRVRQWGKWRPSAEARRIGDKAITLERLLSRDGLTFDEAVQVLTTPAGSPYTAAELEAIYCRIPLRTPRPMLVSDDAFPDCAAVEPDAEHRASRAEREAVARRTACALDSALASVDAEDRTILEMRFWHAMKVPEIAQTLHLDQKKLYKRLDRLFGTLRRGLENAGLSRTDIEEALSGSDHEFHLGAGEGLEFAGPGPSHDEEERRVTDNQRNLR